MISSVEKKPAKVSFCPQTQGDFFSTVKRRVEEYFIHHSIDRHANRFMVSKTVILFVFFFLAYAAILSDAFTGVGLILWYGFLGFMTGQLGFNFSHDVMHGSYFKSQKWNRVLSYVFDINGTSSYVWKLTHNLLHHTYTNIPGHDEDIDKAILLRLSPKDKVYFFHRIQHIYGPFLYAFTTVNWIFYSDYVELFRQIKKKAVSKKEIALFFFFKAVNLTLFLFIPLLILKSPWWVVCLGFLSMHLVGGFTIAIIFQLAHIMEGVEFPFTDEVGQIPKQWAEHELRTTSNFATQSKLCAYFLGGLNFQVEHHLFPYICHVHYPAIAPIVRSTAKEFGLPYHEQPTFWGAIRAHIRTLKRFGTGEF